jgi:hypothetical protein
MTMRRLSRRSVLRGAAGVALGLPFLEVMQAEGAPAAAPKRLVVFFTNNGTIKSAWKPTGGERDFVLGPILAPLEPFRSELVVLSGMDAESSYHGPGSDDPHMPGMAHMLTGTEMITDANGDATLGGGISVDQHVARSLGAPTRFEWLGFGVQAREYRSNAWNSMSYRGAGQPVEPEDDPVAAFDRVFAADATDTAQRDAQRALRRSILDTVGADLVSLQGRLGREDRARLDQHLDSIRSLERSIGTTVGQCQVPPAPDPVAGSLYAHDKAPALFQVQTDLLVHALACDVTRVATLQWREALGSDSTFVWLGQDEPHHEISHRTDGAGIDLLVDCNVWFAEQLAYLLESLRAVPDGDGTLLDHTLVLWCNELSDGAAHSRRDLSWLLAGRCGGALETGRFLEHQGDAHNDLLVSICNLMDVPATTFGNPAYCSGPLARL